MNKSQTKIRLKKRPQKKTLMVVFSAVVVILILHCLFYFVSDGPKTSIARSGTIENVINASGYVIREELLLTAPESGTLSCFYEEGERVSKDSVVAGVYTGVDDEETQLKLNSINERLLAYGDDMQQEKYMTDDTYSVEYHTRNTISNVVDTMATRDMSRALSEKQQLVRLLDRYKDTHEETTYSSLLKEKESLERSYSSENNQITTPVSGVFSTQIDGYEGFFDTSDLSKITSDVLKQADEKESEKKDMEIEKGEVVAKIFDNFEWYYAAEVDAAKVIDLRLNSKVSIRFTDISNNLLPATVRAINKTNDGKAVLVLSCNRYEDLIYRLRKTETEIVFGTYTGIKVPKSAVHVKNDKTGVYVLRDGVMSFKEAQVLYTGETSVIIQESINSSGVMLYDEVITSGRNLQDGRRL